MMKNRRWSTLVLAACFGALFVATAASVGVAQDAASAKYEAPALQQDGSWTLVLVPDPQSYVKFGRNQGILELTTAWIAENKAKLDIRAVVCTGDLVEANDLKTPNGKAYDQTSVQMWSATSRAFSRLDGVLPYFLCTGNHDYGVLSAENRESKFDEYFPIDRNPALDGVLVDAFENALGKKTLENAAYEFEGSGGQKILLVTLEFAPRDETLNWAKELFASPKYAEHFGVVATHSYLRPYTSGLEREDAEGYELNKQGGNSGGRIWSKLVYPSKNIRTVLCGHYATPDDLRGCSGFRLDKNESGASVAQILFDAQAVGGGWHGNGGDGWLQLLEFSKDMTTVKVRTFSPLFAISPETRDKAWNREEYGEFEFRLD